MKRKPRKNGSIGLLGQRAQESPAGQAEIKRLQEQLAVLRATNKAQAQVVAAARTLLPFVYEHGMEGETAFEQAVLQLARAMRHVPADTTVLLPLEEELNKEGWISVSDASALTGYHPVTLRGLIRKGKLEARKYVRDWQVNRQSLLAYMHAMDERGTRRGPKPRRK